MPDEPSERMGWAEPSHWLKSPTRRIARAFGAHTAKEVPRTGPIGPSYSRT
jgi:hypothetical protein